MKQLKMALAACALMMVACSGSDDSDSAPRDGECLVNVSLEEWRQTNEPFDTRTGTRDGDGQSITDLGMTDAWVVVMDVDGHCVADVHQQSSDNGFGLVQLRLKRGTYTVHCVSSRGTGAVADSEAHTITWEKVSDTLWGNVPLDLTDADDAVSVRALLNRVVSRTRIKVSDVLPQNTASLTFTPAHWYYGIDYFTGAAVGDNARTMSVGIPASYLGKADLIVSFFSLVGSSPVDNSAVVALKDGKGATIGESAIAGVTMQRNWSTTFEGSVLVHGNALWVGTEDEWHEQARTF